MATLLGHKSTRMVDLVYGKVADATAAAWVAKLATPGTSLAFGCSNSAANLVAVEGSSSPQSSSAASPPEAKNQGVSVEKPTFFRRVVRAQRRS